MAGIIDFELKQLLESDARVFWAGARPPLARMHASDRIYDPDADHRLGADLHQGFDLVYLVERDLGRIKTWPLVVDEALRLLAPGGRLVIRMTNTPLLSVFELKHQIFAWGDMAPVFEHECEDGASMFGVRSTRTARRAVALDGFSFGVITDGRRPEQLAAFLESVRAVRRAPTESVEVLVCGPASIRAGLATAFPEAIFVEASTGFEDRGWITRKKNQVVGRASQENVVIAHDRYTIEPDFIERMREFGADYAFMVCRQVRPDGRRFPDWVALGSEWSWSAPGMLDYGDWTRHLYINGGIMIAKASCLRAIPWNELLFWNQAEDVELTRRLRSLGHVPRLARRVTAVSCVWRAGTLESFEPLPLAPDRYLGPGPARADGVFVSPSLPSATIVRFGAAWTRTLARLGVHVDEHWKSGPGGLELPQGTFGEVSFRLQVPPEGTLVLRMHVRHAERRLEVIVNDEPVQWQEEAPGELCVRVPRERFAVNRVLRLHVRSRAPGFRLESLRVEPEGWTPGTPLPASAEAAREAADRRNAARGLDGASLCMADLPLLARGARRVAILLPSELGSIVGLAPFLASLRAHVRPDCAVRVVADPSVHALLGGFECRALDWARFRRDLEYRQAVVNELESFAPELVLNAFPARTFGSDLLVHEVASGVALAFEGGDYDADAQAVDAVQSRYTRCVPLDPSSPSSALVHALGLPKAPARLWPDAASRERAAQLIAPLEGAGTSRVAVLGDDPAALARPALARELQGYVADGCTLVGLGGDGTREGLERVLARFGDQALNAGGSLGVAAMFATLEGCDACVGGSPLFRSLGALAGCDAGSGRRATKRLQLQC